MLDGEPEGVLVWANAALAPNMANAKIFNFKVFITIYFLVVDIGICAEHEK